MLNGMIIKQLLIRITRGYKRFWGGGQEGVKLQNITTITTFFKNRLFFLLHEGLGKPKFQLKLTRRES